MDLLNQLFRTKQHTPPNILDRMGIDVHSLFAGLFFIGMTGSGKTSAIRPLMRSILPFVGCCWAAVKADEIDNAVKTILEAGRTPKLLSNFRCNVLAYLLNAPGGTPVEVARYFERLNESLNASKGGDGDSSFWANLFSRTMVAAITIVHLAKRDQATLDDVQQLIVTMPRSLEQYRSKDYEQTKFAKIIRQANDGIKNPDEHRMADLAFSFVTKEFPELGSKAQAAAGSQCAGVLAPLLNPPFFDLFSSPDSTLTPDDVLNGDCVVLDLPVLVYGDGGRFAQQLFLQMTKSALLRRATQYPPVAFVQDEMASIISPDFDTRFSTVSRSCGAINILATQSISVTNALLGGNSLATEQCRALMNCSGTHVVLATNDSESASYYSSLFGEHKELFHSFSENQHDDPDDLMSSIFGGQLQVQNSQQIRPRVTIDDFMKLRTGSPAHSHCVDAFVTQGGRLFPDTGLPYRMVTFSSLE